MKDSLGRTFKQFQDFFFSLDVTKRMGMILVGVVIASFVVIALRWAGKTQYSVLYTELNKDDSSQIARILSEKKINYLIENDGKTIRVPEDQKDIWRLELAKMGLSLTGTVGYEVFDKQTFGTSSFVQKINRQRALEGELVKTIKHLRAVNRARVHLSIPETSPFASEQKPPSASIVLELKRGATMTPGEIKGLASLVSSAVEGMRQEEVVIIDTKGKKLSENIGDSMTADTANRMALETKLSRKLEKKVEDILQKVVGEGKVIAKVKVDMDFTESVTTEMTYDGENRAIVSEVVNKNTLSGSRPSPQGIPGARSNLPGEKPQPGIPETRNNVDKSLITRNYNVPSTITKSKNPSAKIQKISVAVMIDSKQIPSLAEGGKAAVDENGVPVMKSQPWGNKEIENFTAIVMSTLGLNMQRGDSLVIRNMTFAKEDLAAVDAIIRQRENREIIRNIVKYISVGIVIALFFIFVIRPFIQWVTENTVESVEDFLPKTIEELERIQIDQTLPGLEDALPQIEEKVNPEKIEGNMLKEKIISLVDENPAKAAQIVHEMVHSEGVDQSSIA